MKKQHGFTLLELIIALAICSFLAIAIISLIQAVFMQNRYVTAQTLVNDNLGFATQSIRNDCMEASLAAPDKTGFGFTLTIPTWDKPTTIHYKIDGNGDLTKTKDNITHTVAHYFDPESCKVMIGEPMKAYIQITLASKLTGSIKTSQINIDPRVRR
jgi:prepilin-type N-terminal cleavage/methylation domain-containing protein